jgi:hypothetical protein
MAFSFKKYLCKTSSRAVDENLYPIDSTKLNINSSSVRIVDCFKSINIFMDWISESAFFNTPDFPDPSGPFLL